MARIRSTERVIEYSVDFKIKVVELTEKLSVNASEIADVMGLHPVMVYRWRQEYREGKFVAQPTRKISMNKPTSSAKQNTSEKDEIKRLKKQIAALEKENNFLKKWERFVNDQSKNDSRS